MINSDEFFGELKVYPDKVKSSWVRVADGLPPEGTWVIAATQVLNIDSGKREAVAKELFFDGKSNEEVCWLCNGDWPFDVTHWMNMPELPQGA